VTGLRVSQQTLLDWVLDKPSAPVPKVLNAAGLDVYHFAYRARLREALGETFEKCWAWLGDELLDETVAAFVATYPPATWSLSTYGDQFPAFLATHFSDDPEVAELAALEWALHICFSGPDATPVDLTIWSEVDWERAILTLVPTFASICLTTNVAAIWRALDENTEPPSATCLPETVQYRIWRKGFSPHFKAMEPIESRVLGLVTERYSFEHICTLLVSEQDGAEIIPLLGSYLRDWQQDQIIAAIA
jgi:hypothetical protein